ncbi:MAG TPA: LysR family transcriptional regulator [Burkholderiales bacterium]|nr:LysR family transcriptional regulator [Burkholderiales bacterium]
MTNKKSNARLDWEDVRFFAALARHGSLAATARTLEVSQVLVSRRLGRLEAMLGSALFKRRARGYVLTDAGASVLAEAAQMEMAACALTEMCIGTFAPTVPGGSARAHRSSG